MKIIYMIFLLAVSQQLFAQNNTQRNYKSSEVEHLIISNFVGDVKVHVSSGDDISVKVKETRSKENFSVEYLRKDDYVVVFLRTPCTKSNNEVTFDQKNPFGVLSQGNDQNCHLEMDPFNDFPKLTIDVFVPKSVALYLATIKGEIVAKNVESEIYVNNVMGNVVLENVKLVHEAKTVNGNLDISFKEEPTLNGTFTTVNGNIEISMVESSNFEANFKSMMGDMFTDFEETKILPRAIKTISESKKRTCTIGEYTSVQIGKGGTHFTMETINGNAYLKVL